MIGVETNLNSVFHYLKTVSQLLQERINHVIFSDNLGRFPGKQTLRHICLQEVY